MIGVRPDPQGLPSQVTGMTRFLLGLVFGVALSLAYIRYNVELPEVLQLPDLIHTGVVAGAADETLYDLSRPIGERERALEVLMQARAKQVVGWDREEGYPLVSALYRRKARREARQLKLQWAAFDEALGQPKLRGVLERRHGTRDTALLKQRMLWSAYRERTFLSQWLAANGGEPEPGALFARLSQVAWQKPVEGLMGIEQGGAGTASQGSDER
jgi:hypothetical protein